MCVVFLLAPMVVRTPGSQAAIQEGEQNLVVVFVENSLFQEDVDDETSISGKIFRYAKDVQAALPFTKTLILPVSSDTSPGEIFSVLERLYFEGHRRENQFFRLTGTILIGNVPLPVVRTPTYDGASLFPYTDFEDVAFIWDDISQVFRENEENSFMKAEIFHGVIRAPKNSEKTEQQWLSQYFDKNHTFHRGEGESSDQALFFADMIDEAQSINPLWKDMYESAQQRFSADLAFLRYNKTLLDDVTLLFEKYSSSLTDLSSLDEESISHSFVPSDPSDSSLVSLDDLKGKIEEMKSSLSGVTDTGSVLPFPDATTYRRIRQLLPEYIKVVEGYLGDADTKVRNTGRWSFREDTADSIPHLITKMDILSREFLREFSLKTESRITDYVEHHWQKPVPILDGLWGSYYYYPGSTLPYTGWLDDVDPERGVRFQNPFFHGMEASQVTKPEQCSLLRGSQVQSPRDFGDNSQLAELTHLWNKFAQGDLNDRGECPQFGGCCIRNLNEPDKCEPTKAEENVFDYEGGINVNQKDEPTFQECLYPDVPLLARNNTHFTMPQVAEPFAFQGSHWQTDWGENAFQRGYGLGCSGSPEGYFYEKPGGWNDAWEIPFYRLRDVSSIVVHNQPRPETLKGAFQNIFSGVIPSDDKRKITFQGPAGNLVPLEFPDFFSRDYFETDNLTLEWSEETLVKLFQEKEDEIRSEMTLSNYESYISFLLIRKYGLAHDGSRLVPRIPEDGPPLNDILNSFREEAENILKSTYPDAEKNFFLPLADTSDDVLLDALEQLAQSKVFDFENLAEVELIKELPGFLEFSQKGGEVFYRFPYYNSGYTCEDGDGGYEPIYPWRTTNANDIGDTFPKEGYVWPEKYKREKTVADDIQATETLAVPVTNIPAAGFLLGADNQFIKNVGGDALFELFRWQYLTPDEKHSRIIELYLGDETHSDLLGRNTGYEFSSFRAHGNSKELWWEGKTPVLLSGEDPQWDNALKKTPEEESEENTDEISEEKEGKCAKYGDAVSLLKWLPAFECWMEETLDAPVKIEMTNQCNYTNIMDFGSSEDYDLIVDPGFPDVPPGSEMFLSSSLGTQIPVGSETDIHLVFQDADGNILGGGIPFDLEIDSGAEFLDGSQALSEVTYSGEYSVRIRVTDPTAKVTVFSDGFPKRSLLFTAVESGSIVLTEGSTSEDGTMKEVLIRPVGDRGQALTNFFGTASVAVSDPLLASVITPSVPLSNGMGKASITLNVSTPVLVSVTLPGFSPAEILLGGDENSFAAQGLEIRNLPEAIGLREKIQTKVVAVDSMGRERFIPGQPTVQVTHATSDLLRVESHENGNFTLIGGRRAGTARIIIQYPGLKSTLKEVKVVEKISRKTIQRIGSNSLVGSLLGSDFANFAEDGDPIANRILFSGRTQAVISSLNKNIVQFPRFNVNRDGGATAFDSRVIFSVSSLSPLKVRAFDTFTSTSISEFMLSYPNGVDLVGLSDKPSQESYIQFDNHDESGVLSDMTEEDGLHILYEGKPALLVQSNGSFIIADNRFSLQFSGGDEVPVFSLVLNDDIVVGTFTFVHAEMTPLSFPVGETDFFPLVGNDDGSQGFSVSGDKESSILPSGGRALERAANNFALGFNNDDNFALQFASGAIIGDATKYNFGPSGVLLGDPTVSLSQDQKLVTGFNRGIGEEVYRSATKKIIATALFDADADTLPDILFASAKGEVEMVKNLGGMQFRNVGEIFRHPSGVSFLTAVDYDGDDLDDIFLLDGDGKIAAYHNRDEYIESYKEILLPVGSFESFQVANFDGDEYPDILVHEKSGNISVYWGDQTGFHEESKTIVGAFGAKLDGTNLATNNTMVSLPDLSSRVQKFYPLSLGTNEGAAVGIETYEQYFLKEGIDISQETNNTETENTTSTWDMLKGFQEKNPDSFSQDFSGTSSTQYQRIGLFAPLLALHEISVSLFASDVNGGALLKGETAEFTLRVENTSTEKLHFSTAHILHTALHVQGGQVRVPESWPVGRDKPEVQVMGDGRIHVLNIQLNPGESLEMYFDATMMGESAATVLVRDNLDFAPDYPADGLPDITVVLAGLSGNLHYLTTGKRIFEKYFEAADAYPPPEFIEDISNDSDTTCNVLSATEDDLDGDGILDWVDTNNDGVIDAADEDENGVLTKNDPNNGCTPDKYEEGAGAGGIEEMVDSFSGPYQTDSDGDGIPDAWDQTLGNFDEEGNTSNSILGGIGEAVDEVMEYSTCDGGCLDIPINYAFLVPGKINIFETIAAALSGGGGNTISPGGGVTGISGGLGFDLNIGEEMKQFHPAITDGLAVVGDKLAGASSSLTEPISDLGTSLGIVRAAKGKLVGQIPYGLPVFGLLGSLPFVCSGPSCNTSNSPFRIYLSPTLTGAVAVALCFGPFGDHTGKCVAFAPAKLNWACNEDGYDGKKQDYSSATDFEGTGQSCSVLSDTKPSAQVESNTTGGLKGLLYQLDNIGSFTVSYNTGNNKRVINFPWNWVYEQMAEFQGMLTKVPSITVYYPDFSTFSTQEVAKSLKGAFDTTSSVGGEMLDGGENLTKRAAGGMEGMKSDIQAFISRQEYDGMTDEEKKALVKENMKEAVKAASAFRGDARETLGKFEDIYNTFNNIPLVTLDPIDVYVKVPYISRSHIFALMQDLESWTKDAERQIIDAGEEWTGCPKEVQNENPEKCEKTKILTDRILIDAENLVDTAKNNMLILKGYLAQPGMVANLDMIAAQWLSQVVCFLDTSVLYLSNWFVRNKIRLEMWIELWYLGQDTLKIWASLKDVFTDYEKYCPLCRSGRGEAVTGVFESTLNAVLSPPIIRFPRLPDIVIDLSRIKGGVRIPVPRPKLHFVPILFPKLERLNLLGAPVWNVRLPGVPQLPQLLVVPPLPPFPPVPKITLPDIPPVPKLPDFPNGLKSLIGVIKPILVLACIYNKGFYTVDEKTELKSLIEGITARPALKMFRIDFAGALFEDIVIPSIRRLEITIEVNLDMSLGENFIEITKDLFKPWNQAVTDLRKEAASVQNSINQGLREYGGGAHTGQEQDVDLEDIFSHVSRENRDTYARFRSNFTTVLEQIISPQQKMYTPAEIRRRMGKAPIHLPDQFAAAEKLMDLRKKVVALQHELIQEGKTLLASRDFTKIKGEYVADSVLAAQVYDTDIQMNLSELIPFEMPDDSSQEEPVSPEIVPNAYSVFAKSSSGGSSRQDGMYAQCTNEDGSLTGKKLISSDEFTRQLQSTIMGDLDGDGDEEMIVSNRYSIFIKENFTESSPMYSLNTPPEIGKYSQFVPLAPAVKNVHVRSRSSDVRVRYSAHFDSELLGILIDARDHQEDYFLEESQEMVGEEYQVLLLPSRYIPEENNGKYYVPNRTVTVEDHTFTGNIMVRELTKEYERFSLPPEKQWYIRVYEIRPGGLSTGSEIRMGILESTQDLFAPLIMGTLDQEKFLFEGIDLTVPVIDLGGNDGGSDILLPQSLDEEATVQMNSLPEETTPTDHLFPEKTPSSDSSSIQNIDELKKKKNTDVSSIFPPVKEEGMKKPVTVEWDVNGDGIPDFQGEGAHYVPTTPGEHIISVRATDSSGNFTEKEIHVTVTSPEIVIDTKKLSQGIVTGHTTPRIPGVPFILLRERMGKLKKLTSASSNDAGKYVTDEFGDYTIADLSGVLGAELRDRIGNLLARIDASNGKIHLVSDAVSLISTNSGKAAITYTETGRVLAEVIQIADGNSDALIVSDEITPQRASHFSNGVYLSDRISDNEYEIGNIPGDAPDFPGGAAVFSGDTIIALFSVFGEPKIIDKSFTFRAKNSDNYDDPLVLELVDAYGTVQFDFVVRSSSNQMFMISDKIPQRKFYSPKPFLPLPKESSSRKMSRFQHFFWRESSSFLKKVFSYSRFHSLESYQVSRFFEDMKQKIMGDHQSFDLCPEVPEDLDGIDDEDGCPEFDFEVQFIDLPSGIYLTPGYSDSPKSLLDFLADIRPGDTLFTAITSEDDSEVFAQSELIVVPEDLTFSQ